MSAITGSGEPLTMSFKASAASWSGTAPDRSRLQPPETPALAHGRDGGAARRRDALGPWWRPPRVGPSASGEARGVRPVGKASLVRARTGGVTAALPLVLRAGAGR